MTPAQISSLILFIFGVVLTSTAINKQYIKLGQKPRPLFWFFIVFYVQFVVVVCWLAILVESQK